MKESAPTSRTLRALRVLVGVLLITPALWLLAYGPRASRPAPPQRVVVTYWEKWTDFEGEAMRRLTDVFNRTLGAEKGIFVDYVTTTQIDLKTLVATAGGDPPDIAGLWPQNISSYAAKNALQPLDARAAAAGITRDRLIPVYYDQCCYHDRLYGLTVTPWSLALYYNKGLLREFAGPLAAAGYDAEQPPHTLAALLDYCRIVQRRAATGDYEMLAFIPATPETIGWYYSTWGLYCGGSFVDPQTRLARFDTPAFQQGFGWVADYVRMLGAAPVLRFESSLANFNSPDNPFMKGRLAMMQQGPWFANMIRQYGPDIDYGVAPFPSSDGRETCYCGQDMLVIPTGAHHPDQAWTFIAWLYNAAPLVVPSGEDEPQLGYEYCQVRTPAGLERRPMPPLTPVEWICWNHYKNSPLRVGSPAFFETHPNPGVAMHDRLARSPAAQGDPPLPNWFEILAALCNTYRGVWAGRTDVAEQLRICQERVDRFMAISRREQERYGDVYP
jgi:multiple sugar transport system substrate-binding protein